MHPPVQLLAPNKQLSRDATVRTTNKKVPNGSFSDGTHVIILFLSFIVLLIYTNLYNRPVDNNPTDFPNNLRYVTSSTTGLQAQGTDASAAAALDYEVPLNSSLSQREGHEEYSHLQH